MAGQAAIENIIRRRMHGLYLSRACEDLETLSHELLGLHCWFHRNVPFSALIRGAGVSGWKTRLTKTWLYRGTLHGVAYEVLPKLLRRYFTAYGPATLADAAYFFGISKEDAAKLPKLMPDDMSRMEIGGKTYYYIDTADIADIPELTLLSGFDPILVSYTAENRFSLPQEHKSKVILKSGICLPAICVDGRVAGVWNIKKNAPVVEFFAPQPQRIESAALEGVETMIRRTRSYRGL
jgi:hypothetical protein